MGTSINGTRCDNCGEEFSVVLEWLYKEDAVKEIEKTMCPNCESDNWYFTDDMGQ